MRGYNLGPGSPRNDGFRMLLCMWNDETPAAAEQGQYLPLEQTVGDDIAQIECPAPAQPLGPGQSARLRVSLGGSEGAFKRAARLSARVL